MATTPKPKDAPTPPSPPTDQPERSIELQRCDLVAEACWDGKAPYPDLEERLLCIGYELGQLARDAERQVKEGSTKTFAYHSIDQVENEINRLQMRYRVRIVPSVTSTHDFPGGVAVTVHFTARCWQLDQTYEWDWIDDGQDLSKAGAFAVKYGILRHFGVGDGSVDVSESLGKTEIRSGGSASRAGAPTPTTTQSSAPVNDEAKAELYAIAKLLPESAGWGFRPDGANVKIDAQLQSPAFTPEKIKANLLAAYKKAHGKDYEPVVTEGAAATAGTEAPAEPREVGDGYPG